MSSFNRRNWLKASGLLGTAAVISGTAAAHELILPETPKAAGPIRLSSNENPLGPSPLVRKAMSSAFDEACRYPGMYLPELRDMLAAKEGVTKDHIIITGGSTEGLKITGVAYGMYGGEIIAARPTFLAMMNHAEQFGATVNWVDVKEDMSLDLDEMEKRISTNTKLIFLCNPNNPTSTIVSANELKQFCEAASERVMVFSDEAYYDFIEEPNYPSMVELVKEGKNVIVSRTFSKVYGLAGLRIGYMVARPDIAAKLKDQVVAFTNVLALKAAVTALKDDDFYAKSVAMNRKGKEMIYKTLDDLGRKYVKSHTNFVFFHSGIPIGELQEKFREENIFIGRPFPPFYDWCRISTGTLDEVEAFCNTLKKMYT